MKTYQRLPAKSARAAAAHTATAFPGAFGVETMESRQLMSAAPGVGSVGTVAALQNPAISMSKSPALATGTKTTIVARAVTVATPAKAADAQATAVVKTAVAKSAAQTPTTPTPPPPAGDGTVMTRSLWGRIKSAAKWVKNHVVIGLNKIGIKGTF